MKSITFFLMMLVAMSASVSAKVAGGVSRHPAHPGKCLIGDSLVLEEGQVIKNHNGECKLITCFENEHHLVMECVQQKLRDGCTLGKVEHPGAEFPQCCRREIQCQDHYYSNKEIPTKN